MRIMLNVVLAGMLQIALAGALSAGELVRVTIDDLAFAPSDAHAEPGDTIEWVNEDFLDHTATETSGAWDVEIPAGKSARLEITRAGTLTYFCRVHPGMTGTIHVIAK